MALQKFKTQITNNKTDSIKGLLVGVLVMGLGLLAIWPVVVNPARVANYGTDGELISWITNQTVQKVTGNFRRPEGQKYTIWDGNIFYPYRNVLGYSDLFMMAALWATLPVVITGNPAVTAGVGLVVGQLLTMGIAYWWWKEMTGERTGAMIAAVTLGWAQFHFEYQVHLQMWNMQYWLGAAYCFWKWMKTGRFGWGIGSAVLLGVQAWESVLPVYFAAAMMGTMAVFDIKFFRSNAKKIIIFMLLAGGIMAPPAMMYLRVSREFGYQRSIREAAHNGLSVDDTWSWFGNIGLVILVAVGVMKIIRHKRFNKDLRWMMVVAAVGYIMALGPVLKWQEKTVKVGRIFFPLPYTAAYYLVPGFGALRTPSRWIWLSGWAMCGVIALGFSEVNGRKSLVGIAGALVVATAGGVHLTRYIDLPQWDTAPAVYKWLAEQPGQVVLELPAGIENLEDERMMYSMWTKKTLINGTSGFSPPAAKGVKPDYIIVHQDECSRFRIQCNGEGKVVWQDLNTVVYKL